MFDNIFNSAKAHIKGGKKYPQIDGIIAFKETKDGVFVKCYFEEFTIVRPSCAHLAHIHKKIAHFFEQFFVW